MTALALLASELWSAPGRAGVAFRCVAVFFFGLTHEALNVAWVHFSEAGQPGGATLVALLNTTVAFFGLEGALKNRPVMIALILGEATGTFLAVALKGKRS